MPGLTKNRAAVLAALVAAVAYLLAVRNGWAGDDMVAIRDNPATKSIGAALGAWFEPYWPEGFRWAGLYRPFTILTYGVDWAISGGAVWWFHLTNVVLHALVVFLVVLVAAAWLPPIGALVAGLLFALHPVHVEAVANTVGRAEVLVAIFLLASVLLARRYRDAETRRRGVWHAATLVTVVLGMASKEHGVIAIALIGLDHVLERDRPHLRDMTSLYLTVLATTVAWLFLWRGIAGAYVAGSGHAALVYLSGLQRLATMFPVYLEVLRLLAWPFRLASDYSPQVFPIRLSFGGLAWLGFVSSTALITLGLVTVKRAPPIAFGILAAAVSYLPTSNLLFASGVVLGERNLYLAVLAPSLLLGWAAVRVPTWRHGRAVLIGMGALLIAFGVRTVDRIPFWIDAQNPIVEEQTAHPENYQTRVVLARHLAALRDSSWALAELLVAGELLPTDPGAAVLATRLAAAQGRKLLALREAKRAYGIMPHDPAIIELLTRAYYELGETDSALAVAAAGADSAPSSTITADSYVFLLAETDAPNWRRFLIEAKRDWLSGELASATMRLDSTAMSLPGEAASDVGCADVRRTLPVVEALNPILARRLTAPPSSGGAGCTEYSPN
jgi:hypothetical protein